MCVSVNTMSIMPPGPGSTPLVVAMETVFGWLIVTASGQQPSKNRACGSAERHRQRLLIEGGLTGRRVCDGRTGLAEEESHQRALAADAISRSRRPRLLPPSA